MENIYIGIDQVQNASLLLALGLYRIFRRFRGKSFVALGGLFLTTLALLFVLHARVFMLAQLFMPLLAAGSIFVEELLARLNDTFRKRVLKISLVFCLVAGFLVIAPSAVPVLPVSMLPAYAEAFGFLYKPVKDFNDPKSNYPQEFSNRIGWEEMVQTVAGVYDGLSSEDRKKAGIFAEWYGPAGAVDLLGEKYGLPHAVSGHLSYYLWGPGDYSWDEMIVITQNISPYYSLFDEIEKKADIVNAYAMPYNTNLGVYICKKANTSPDKLWPYMKYYK
jgi:hypothetical protein